MPCLLLLEGGPRFLISMQCNSEILIPRYLGLRVKYEQHQQHNKDHVKDGRVGGALDQEQSLAAAVVHPARLLIAFSATGLIE